MAEGEWKISSLQSCLHCKIYFMEDFQKALSNIFKLFITGSAQKLVLVDILAFPYLWSVWGKWHRMIFSILRWLDLILLQSRHEFHCLKCRTDPKLDDAPKLLVSIASGLTLVYLLWLYYRPIKLRNKCFSTSTDYLESLYYIIVQLPEISTCRNFHELGECSGAQNQVNKEYIFICM